MADTKKILEGLSADMFMILLSMTALRLRTCPTTGNVRGSALSIEESRMAVSVIGRYNIKIECKYQALGNVI